MEDEGQLGDGEVDGSAVLSRSDFAGLCVSNCHYEGPFIVYFLIAMTV